MSRLLAYLVERAITDCARDTSEYAIGIGVFDRDPLHYSPGEDPVVRVQVGRLRTKLKTTMQPLNAWHALKSWCLWAATCRFSSAGAPRAQSA